MAYPEKVFPPLDKRHAQADLLSRSTRRNVRPGILWFDEYTYMHSVSVCALMIALARQLGLPAETGREGGLAGLLQRAAGSDAGAEPEGAAGAEGQGVLFFQIAPAVAAGGRRLEQAGHRGSHRRTRVSSCLGLRASGRTLEWHNSVASAAVTPCHP